MHIYVGEQIKNHAISMDWTHASLWDLRIALAKATERDAHFFHSQKISLGRQMEALLREHDPFAAVRFLFQHESIKPGRCIARKNSVRWAHRKRKPFEDVSFFEQCPHPSIDGHCYCRSDSKAVNRKYGDWASNI